MATQLSEQELDEWLLAQFDEIWRGRERGRVLMPTTHVQPLFQLKEDHAPRECDAACLSGRDPASWPTPRDHILDGTYGEARALLERARDDDE